MSIWDDNNLDYLLIIFKEMNIKSTTELSSIIFLINYYSLLYYSKSYFSYKFLKTKKSLIAPVLQTYITQMIRERLLKYHSGGVYKLTQVGAEIEQKYRIEDKIFTEILLKFKTKEFKQNVEDFSFIKRKKEGEIIII